MKAGILKLTALTVVIGIGVLVVLQAKQGLDAQKPEASAPAGELGTSDDESADSTASTGDSAEEAEDGFTAPRQGTDEDDEIVPAERKIPAHSRKTAGSKDRSRRSGPASADRRAVERADDEFDRLIESDEETAGVITASGITEEQPRASSRRPAAPPASRASVTSPSAGDSPDDGLETESATSAEDSGEDADEALATIRSRIRAQRSLDESRPDAPARGRIESVDDDGEDEADEDVEFTPSSRRALSAPAGSRKALSAPDDDEELEDAGRLRSQRERHTNSAAGRPEGVVPAANTDDAETVALPVHSDDLETEDESGFAGRRRPAMEMRDESRDLSTGNPAPKRTSFLDDEEAEPAMSDETDSPAAPSRLRSSVSAFEDEASETGLDAEPDSAETAVTEETEAESPATGGLLDDDEPLGGGAPAQAGQASDIDDARDSPPAERPSGQRPKTPQAAAEPEEDNDPLEIHRRPAATAPSHEDRPVSPSTDLPRPGKASTSSSTDSQSPKRPRPRLTIEKKAPEIAVTGRPMVYQIVVRNVGPIVARGVTVEDTVPAGIRVDGSKPQAQLDGRRLTWRLGVLEPGSEQTIAVRVTPQAEGTLGGVATVHFDSEGESGARNGPRLQVNIDAPRKVVVGQPVNINFKIRNVGTTDASNVLIHNVLPAALRHSLGDDIEYEIGDLAAGATREVQLQLTAASAGQAVNRAVITADGAVSEETVVQLDVIGPALTVSRAGPKKLSPGKKGRFTNTVSNPTTADLENVTLTENVPPGFEFVDATDGGAYDAARRVVTWSLGGIQPRESKSVSISLNSVNRGPQVSVVRASDVSGASGESLGTTHVVGVPALSIEIRDLPGAVDTGEEVRVPIRVFNRGTDFAGNVRVTIDVPPTLELVNISGPAKYQRSTSASGRPRTEIRFDAVKSVDVKKYAEFELVMKGRVAGGGRLKVQAACDQAPEPIQREDEISVVSGE